MDCGLCHNHDFIYLRKKQVNTLLDTIDVTKTSKVCTPAGDDCLIADNDGNLSTEGDLFPQADNAGLFERVANGWRTVGDHFNDFSGWTWAAYSGYTTPSSISTSYYNSLLRLNNNNLTDNHFAYKAWGGSTTVIEAKVGKGAASYIGLRADDGTDDNYAELSLIDSSTAARFFALQVRYRTGGGAVTTVEYGNLLPMFYTLRLSVSAVSSPYNFAGYYNSADIPLPMTVPMVNNLSWTISRVGLIFGQRGSTVATRSGLVDWVWL